MEAAGALGCRLPAPSVRRSSVARWKQEMTVYAAPVAKGWWSWRLAGKQAKMMARFKVLGEGGRFSAGGAEDLEMELQDLFVKIKNKIEVGERESAIDLLRANYELAVEQIEDGSRGIEQAAILVVVALGYTLVDDLKQVDDILEMLDEIVSSLHDHMRPLDAILLHIGSMWGAVGKFEDALLAYERSLKILEGRFGKMSPFLIQGLMAMAKICSTTGSTTKATNIYQRAIRILEFNRGDKSEELVVPLIAFGNMLLDIDKADEAERCFQRIIDIYVEAYGENDGRTGMAFSSLGRALCAKGDADKAIHLYKKGLQIIKETNFMPLDDGILEKLRIDLAELLHAVGREQEGRELIQESLFITERHKGIKHPSSVFHLLNLAASHSRSKNFVEAERILRICLSICQETFSPNDQALSVPMLRLAIVLYHLRHDEEAENLALDALRIRKDTFGADSLPVGEALDCLASIQVRLGREDSEVLRKLNRLLAIQENNISPESEEVMNTLKKILFILERMGKKEEKAPILRRLTHLRNLHKKKMSAV